MLQYLVGAIMEKKNIFWLVLIVLIVGGGLTYRYFVRETDSRGATRLMRAIEQNDSFKSTAKLIQKVPDVNVRDKKGQSALFYAIKHSHDEELVRNLLMAGADITTPDKNGDTPLMLAARENPSGEIIEMLVRYGGDVHQTDKDGHTPLALAARYNAGTAIEALLRTEADLDVIDKNGKRLEDLLVENMKLSDMEKNNYRQVMFIVSLLETRAAARAMRDAEEQLQQQEPPAAVEKEEPANTPLEEETAAQTELVEAEQAENQ